MKKLFLPAMLMLFPTIALAQEEAEQGKNQAAAKAPAEAKQTPSKNLLKPTNDLESWQFELTDTGQGTMEVDGDTIVFHITETTGTNWHVQAYQTALPLKEGKQYVVKFKMKSPDYAQVLLLGLINEEDWHEIGLHEEIYPDKEFRDYEYTFTPHDVVEDNNRIGFVLGTVNGTVVVKDMTLTAKMPDGVDGEQSSN